MTAKRKENDMTTEERLEKLERELTAAKRRNRWILGCGATLILCCLTIAATPRGNRTIRANEYFLEDENGKPRAHMSADKNGPGLSMTDENGKIRTMIDVGKKGPGLAMYDENDKIRAMLFVGKKGTSLSMNDENGEARAHMVVGKNGPILQMDDENGNARAKMVVDKDGAGMAMMDANGNMRAGLAVGKDKGPGLTMFDADGKNIWDTRNTQP